MTRNSNGRFRNASDLSIICAKTLTGDEKTPRLSIYKNLLQRVDDENILKNVFTGDVTWVYGYDFGTKQQFSHWKSPASLLLKKARQVRSRVKEMLLGFFFDHRGITNSFLKVR